MINFSDLRDVKNINLKIKEVKKLCKKLKCYKKDYNSTACSIYEGFIVLKAFLKFFSASKIIVSIISFTVSTRSISPMVCH